jgi:hypothetical protein
MTSYTLSPVWGAGAQLFDNSGNVLTGGKIETYEAGTTTPAATYTTPTGNTFNSNPIVADASGRLSNEIWLLVGSAYKFVLKDANNVLIATYDNIPSSPQPPVTNDASSISYEQGYTVTAGAFTVGATYRITSVGTTNFVAIGAAANATGVLFTATGVGSGNGTAEYSRTVQAKLRETASVKDFGAVGDGVTNDTVAIQAACNTASAIFFPSGTYLVNNLDIPSDTCLYGADNEKSIIKRINNGTGNTFIGVSNKSNIKFSNLQIDGNKDNQTNAAHNISIFGCEQATVEYCLIKNAKAVSGGFGAGIAFVEGTNDSEVEQSLVSFNTIESCDNAGIYISKDSFISITDNLLKSNSDGVVVINFVFPPVQYVQNYFTITNNRCLFNTGTGIRFVGFYTGGTSSFPIQGPGMPPQKGVVISNNICKSNGQYGIAYQGYGATITGNFVEANGTTSSDGGILVNAWGTTVTGNSVLDNSAYGIDGGGSVQCLFNSNVISYQGNTSGLSATGINIGGTVDCQAVGNILENNGGANSASIYASGWEFGGNTYFDQLGARLLIANNQIKLSTPGALGIYFNHGFDNVTLTGNQVNGGAANNSYILRGGSNEFKISPNNNIDWDNGGLLIPVASASTLIIPDVGNDFIVTGTTGITKILTNSANIFDGRVRFVQMINNGTGYSPSSPPSVTFSAPPSGITATGTALVSNSGRVIGVQITDPGSGYTSAPTVTFGSGAATGTARIGCDNFTSRTIILRFTGGVLTVTQGNNLQINGNFTSAAGGVSILELTGAFNTWYEISRRV